MDDWRVLMASADPLPGDKVRVTCLIERADGEIEIEAGDMELVEWLSLEAARQWSIAVADG